MKGSPVRVRASAFQICRDFRLCWQRSRRLSGTKRVHLLTRSRLVKLSSCAEGPCRFAGISTLAAVGSLYPYVPARGRECPRFPAATSGVRSRQIPSPQIDVSQPLLLLVLIGLREEALVAELLECFVDPVARLSDLVGIPPREAPRLDSLLEGLGPVAQSLDQHLDLLLGPLWRVEFRELVRCLPLEIDQLRHRLLDVSPEGLVRFHVLGSLREALPALAALLGDALKALAELLARQPLLTATARDGSEAGGQ